MRQTMSSVAQKITIVYNGKRCVGRLASKTPHCCCIIARFATSGIIEPTHSFATPTQIMLRFQDPLAMLAAQCNRLAQRSPPPLTNALALGNAFSVADAPTTLPSLTTMGQ